MLLAIARALQLDEDATAYLLQLAKPPSPRSKRTRRPEKVSDSIRTLISSWPLTPAYVDDKCTHILAANTLATALCPFITPGRNAILDAFTEPEMRELRPDWDAMTARAVPHLRSIAGADSGDPRLVELVGELSLRSERFRTLWARQDAKHETTGTSLFNHPQVGPLELNYERLLIAGSDMQALVTYHAQPGSDSEERLRLLDTITTPHPTPPYRHDQSTRTRQPRTTSQRDDIPGRHWHADSPHTCPRQPVHPQNACIAASRRHH